MKRFGLNVLSVVMILPLLAGCAVVDRVAGRKQFNVPSEGMEPTVKKGSRVTAAMTTGEYVPKMGDVILFEVPKSWGKAGTRMLRVIGIPGATVECCDNQGRMSVNKQPLEEPYIMEPPASYRVFGPVIVPPGRLWVLGDNRHISLDSRSYLGEGANGSTIPVSGVVGVVDLARTE
jgi:signal peptidase I